VAFGAGAVAVFAVLRTWGAKRPEPAAVAPLVHGTPDELERLAAAIRDDA
jgi:hypothetical protein